MSNWKKSIGFLAVTALIALPGFIVRCVEARATETAYPAVSGVFPVCSASAEASPRTDSEASGETSSEADDWRLRLVNHRNPLPEDYLPTLTQLINGQAIDERCYPDLQKMMDACRASGLSPLICSSYRTWETQQALYENKIERLLAEGYDAEAAISEAGTVVAVPGTSEHQLGLAVDIVDMDNQNLDESQESTAVQRWLMEHSWEYGWILRYPSDKSDITGIIYEPWHYRYVGKDAAREIHTLGVCLEEYLGEAPAQRPEPSQQTPPNPDTADRETFGY